MEGHPRRPLILYNIARCFEDLSQLREARDAYREYLESSAGEPEQRADVARRLRELDALLPDDRADDATPPDTTPQVVSTESGSPPSTTSPGGGISPIGPIVLGVGGALLIGGAVTGGLAIGARGNLTGMCTGMACPGSAEGLVSDVGTLALTADVLLLGGAAVAATGLLLLLVLEEEPSSGAVAGFSCDRTGCVATVAGRFE